ncbi:hypothetical protein PMIN05_008285 [Paraphaeosphaeria minitans]
MDACWLRRGRLPSTRYWVQRQNAHCHPRITGSRGRTLHAYQHSPPHTDFHRDPVQTTRPRREAPCRPPPTLVINSAAAIQPTVIQPSHPTQSSNPAFQPSLPTQSSNPVFQLPVILIHPLYPRPASPAERGLFQNDALRALKRRRPRSREIG